MKFFSGFSLQQEEHFFLPFIKRSDFTICGFSYGAIQAFQAAQESLVSGKRVDTLQLFSPAFFETTSDKFKRLQMLSYTKERSRYMQNFIDACFAPYSKKEVAFRKTTKDELHELLTYKWSRADLNALQKQGVNIEVYLGGNDKIIDVNAARAFFLDVATVTYIKEGNHFLLTE
jgi:surfactin synthase thioesterase subunit